MFNTNFLKPVGIFAFMMAAFNVIGAQSKQVTISEKSAQTVNTVQAAIMSNKSKIIFTDEQELENWIIVNDTVMGGRSRAAVDIKDDFLLFGGDLSLRNNGGFASIRRIYSTVEWQENRPIKLQVMGDGREYQLRLRTSRNWDGVAYVASFQTKAGELQELTFNLNDFSPQFRGRLVRNARDLQFSDVSQIGIMLADKRPGQFFIKLKSIEQVPEII